MNLDLRKLRYFAAVAEHQHFGRAAEELFISQPVLSRQIRALEDELGCALLERTTRAVRLTPAGQQLLADAPAVLNLAESTTRRVHEVARGLHRVVAAFAPGLRITEVVAEFARRQPAVEVEPLGLPWYDQAPAIRGGRGDVGYLRGRVDDPGLRIIEVGTEPRVACLPAGHPLAGRRRLTTAALQDELMLDAEARRVAGMEEKFELVAAGRGIVVIPRSVAKFYARAGLVYRTVADVEPDRLCLAVVRGPLRSEVSDFLDCAVEILRAR